MDLLSDRAPARIDRSDRRRARKKALRSDRQRLQIAIRSNRSESFRSRHRRSLRPAAPAAALSVHTLVDDVSFFSIGTNDLVQYTLAVDRGSANLASRFTPLHPAVLTLIKRIVDVGVAHRLEVAVCGEMASQPLMAFALIGLGVRSLSVAGRAVPLVKRIVRGVSVAVAADLAVVVDPCIRLRTSLDGRDELFSRHATLPVVR